MSDTAGWTDTVSPAPTSGPLADFLPACDNQFHTLWVHGSGSDLASHGWRASACSPARTPEPTSKFVGSFVTFHGEVGGESLEADDEEGDGVGRMGRSATGARPWTSGSRMGDNGRRATMDYE